MPKIQRSHDRSDSETTMTTSVPRSLKMSLIELADKSDRSVSQLVRYAVAYCEQTGWRDIPEVAPYVKTKGK